MGEFEKPIHRVQRRLWLQGFLSTSVWALTALLAVAAVLLGLEKARLLNLPGPLWAPPAVAAGLALLGSGLATWFRRPSRLDAAVAIDQRFELRERLSTALSLPDDLRGTPAGQAVLRDALSHVRGLSIGERFGLTRPRLAWIPLVPAALAVAIAFLPDNLFARDAAKPVTVPQKESTKKAVTKALKSISANLAQKRKETPKTEATEVGKLLAELEKSVDDLSKKPNADKQQTLVELNKMANAVEERRKQVGGAEQIQRQLEQLKQMASGPAEDFARALSKGDLQKATQELKTLQEKMAKGELSEKEKEQLAQQLAEMKKQLDKLANQDEQRKQLEDARKNGLITEQQYQQQKQKLDQQKQAMQGMQKLAQQMGEAQQAMQQGDQQKAQQAMQQAQQQLQEMAQNAEELQSLDEAMADLQEAKESMSDSGNQLGKDLDGMASMMNGMGNRPGNGNGMGRGRGQGDRPEAPDDTAAYDSKVKQQITRGKAVLGGFADPSKQTRGESVLEIQGNVEASAEAASEALTDQRIPSALKKHVQGYFDQVRKGE